jgi:hypothetical protein
MTLFEKLAELVQGKQTIPGYKSVAGLGELAGNIGEPPKESTPLTNSLTGNTDNQALSAGSSTPEAVSGRSAIQTPVRAPVRSVNKSVPRPVKTPEFTKIPDNVLAKPFSKMAHSRNTGIVDIDGNSFVNDEDVELLGKLGFDVTDYTQLEKSSEVLDLYSYIEKHAGIPKAVARAVSKGEAFSGSFLEDMGYSVPEGYEMKGDLCCPVEKTALPKKESSEKTASSPFTLAPNSQPNIQSQPIGVDQSTPSYGSGDTPYGKKPVLENPLLNLGDVASRQLLGKGLPHSNLLGALKSIKDGDMDEAVYNIIGTAGEALSMSNHPVAKSIGKGIDYAADMGSIANKVNKYSNRPVAFHRSPENINLRPNNDIPKSPLPEIPASPQMPKIQSPVVQVPNQLNKSGEANIPLVSSNLKAVGHDRKTKTLDVAFRNGGEYTYKDVPHSLFQRLLKAKSHGKFFHKHIKKDNPFKYSKTIKDEPETH